MKDLGASGCMYTPLIIFTLFQTIIFSKPRASVGIHWVYNSTPPRSRGVLLKYTFLMPGVPPGVPCPKSCTWGVHLVPHPSCQCTGVGIHPHRVVYPGSLWVKSLVWHWITPLGTPQVILPSDASWEVIYPQTFYYMLDIGEFFLLDEPSRDSITSTELQT